MELLNEQMYQNVFKKNKNMAHNDNDKDYEIPNEQVILAYRIFLFYLNKTEIALKKNKHDFWREVCNFFLNQTGGKIGEFVQSSINSFNFSTDNIYKISKVIGNDTSKLTSNTFTDYCATTGLLFFLLKDALEYSGIIVDKKTPLATLMNLLEYKVDKFTTLKNTLGKVLNKD
jgi:hypothetical protein